MNRIVRQIRLTLFVYILGFAARLLPSDADATHVWLTKIPFEE